MIEQIKIPKKRIAVLIGEKGLTKQKIEKKTSTILNVGSKNGDINIEGKISLNVYLTKKIIMAIGRGFNPDVALSLLNDKNFFEMINIHDLVGKSKNQEIRIKSRVIGTRGKARIRIEEMTGVHISIYGKTIGIIGSIEGVDLARRALEKLINGSPHQKVYQWIEMQQLEEEI
jgi:ribosomal RNA assembly protein